MPRLAACAGAMAAALAGLGGCAAGQSQHAAEAADAEPLVIGDSFVLESAVLGEDRRINVFVPTIYGEPIGEPMPVLYMPDGGLGEDFLHIAGLVQVLVCNGGMRPFIVVGIENTQRRRDLTGPTSNPEDREIAPTVGGSGPFRRFIREELKPAVRARYDITAESAILGESLAGLFVVETLLLEPGLFDAYIAADPSLWWDNASLVTDAESGRRTAPTGARLFLASSDEPELAGLTGRLAAALASPGCRHAPMPEESHATIFHPAALRGLRETLAPASAGGADAD
ncbi:MAG: alpha/beta hydrolase [Phycisphaerales bacterium]|nr:alpha/beta hydrolase [Phycisphaerales bacterium]